MNDEGKRSKTDGSRDPPLPLVTIVTGREATVTAWEGVRQKEDYYF